MSSNEECLRVDRYVDAGAAPYFDRERRLENAFLAIRVARNARAGLTSSQAGAIAQFPGVLYGPFRKNSGCGAAGQWAIKLSHEPGSVFPVGVTSVRWGVDLGDRKVLGEFAVVVLGPDSPDPEVPEAFALVDKVRVESPLPSIVLRASGVRSLEREVVRLEAAAHEAKGEVISLSRPLLEQIVNRLRPSFDAIVGRDDAFQAASIEALRLAEQKFAGPTRPAAAWGRVLGMNANRAVVRLLEMEHGQGRPEQAVKQLFGERPELASADFASVRRELEARHNEAKSWSDDRILRAVRGPQGSLAMLAGPTEEPAIDLPIDSLVDGLFATAEDRDASRAFVDLEITGRAGDKDVPSWSFRRSRRAFFVGIGRRLGVEATDQRSLIEAFAEPGESFDDPDDRDAMQRRARSALLAVMEQGGDGGG